MSKRPLQYFKETGEPFKEAVRRLAREYCLHRAASILGYGRYDRLLHDMRELGLEDVQFRKAGLHYTLDGMTMTLREHAERLGLNYRTVWGRIRHWGLCDRIFEPPQNRGRGATKNKKPQEEPA